jgi:hypothetical protein
MNTPIPLGCFKCDHCDSVSEVYAYSICCTECHDHVCEDCIVGERNDDDTGSHGLCRRCDRENSGENYPLVQEVDS